MASQIPSSSVNNPGIFIPNIQIITPRLRIRSYHPLDTPQFRKIRSDPDNNEFDAIPGPNTDEQKLKDGIQVAIDRKCNQLLIIKDPPVFPPGPNPPLDLCLSEDPPRQSPVSGGYEDNSGGLLIGYIEICWPEEDHDDSDIGGYIHHRFTGHGYAQEAFAAVFDYALTTLQRPAVYLETLENNAGFRRMMKGLGLEALERHQILGKPCVTWSFNLARWEQAKRETGRS